MNAVRLSMSPSHGTALLSLLRINTATLPFLRYKRWAGYTNPIHALEAN